MKEIKLSNGWIAEIYVDSITIKRLDSWKEEFEEVELEHGDIMRINRYASMVKREETE